MVVEERTPLMTALISKRVKAQVVDVDHYRIRGGMAVETDYIIQVEPVGKTSWTDPPNFETFRLSKTYSAFRTLGHQLKKASDLATSTTDPPPKAVQKLAQCCEIVIHLVESQRTQYLGKVNYNYVKVLAKKRTHIINETLEAILSYFPDNPDRDEFYREVAQTVETFLLLDHCIDDDHSIDKKDPTKTTGGDPFQTPTKGGSPSTANDSSGDNQQESQPAQPLVNAVDLGSAVEHVVENVGSFLKEKLGDHSKRGNGSIPHPVMTELRSPVVPYTRKSRRSLVSRGNDEEELNDIGEEANLLLDDERPPTELVPSYSHPVPTFGSPGSKLGDLLETNPIIFFVIFLVSVSFLQQAAKLTVSMDLDILLLLIWTGFCIGLHTPRPMVGGIDKSTAPMQVSPMPARKLIRKHDSHGRQLLRMSMASTPDASGTSTSGTAFESTRSVSAQDIKEEEGIDDIMEHGSSPLPMFPEGAPLGSKLNCWSEPEPENFYIRGANYLSDKIKEASGPFMFPVRAVDLFLTDKCPENAGSNGGVLGGHLREKPTFIINFRLPWGILLAYFEIPDRFIPFIRAGHEEGFDGSNLPSLDDMTPSDRCVARFCLDPQAQKNKKLKIVPVVVEGPWVVKSVVGGKPAIIGNKLPVNYHYAPAEGDKQLYLEADLDIVASSAARGILSVARTYTQVLTIDLGFVVQGNSNDELAEQMLIATRLHGIDPMSAPPYPPTTKDMLMHSISEDSDSDE